ncbi:hypothetical protein [Pedobacter nyackensis]|uniref:Uncharacterized protein n=1 Tax=Pedobacter nyackensis TaxID=475255 RepID=A0A1W2CYQ1_9SPHI|nr:hypothetical protein [Pedobacter nyackensis]SMC89994.1 hypothetical protein SAMN04488101_10554 [Pedobacter nyackensis]
MILRSGMKNTLLYSCIVLLFFTAGCAKVEYAKIDDPAYLRVFNNLNYKIGIDNKDEQLPFLTMLIDPEMDQNGVPVSAKIKGDFLDKRDPYAPPYPSHIGSGTSINNPEYPGRENVLVGPVLNGFDLSSWAQIPSGKHRIVFMFRPKNDIPFFNLDPKLKKNVLIDTTIVLDHKEVYTLHVLQKDYDTKRNGIYLRKENFHKLPLSDSSLYVNFYNMSAKGYWQADNDIKGGNIYGKGAIGNGIKDEMNIFLTLYKNANVNTLKITGYSGKYMGRLVRNSDVLEVAPYYNFPLFADATAGGIHTEMWQRFDFLAPGMDITNIPYGPTDMETDGNWASINCLTPFPNYRQWNEIVLPNMIVNIHSGKYNPRSFATVNTIEIVNGNVYLTTIQRKYAPPVY